MKLTKSQLKQIIKEELEEQEREPWLPNTTPETSALVSQLGKDIDWDVGAAMAIAVGILEDTNAHEMAQAVNSLLLKMEGRSSLEEGSEEQKKSTKEWGSKSRKKDDKYRAKSKKETGEMEKAERGKRYQ